MTKALKFIWNMLRSHLVLKIMALLFAVILWSYVIADTNPARMRVMNDIKVRYENMAELKAKGLDISASLSEVLDTVNIRVEVRQNDLKYLSSENVRAFVDLSTINGKGTPTLEISATTTYGQVIEVSPSTVTLFVDDYVRQSVPVNVDVAGSVAQGYHADEPVISPNVITVSGARVDVEKVASAVCHLDITGLTEGYNKSVEIEFLDGAGNPVDKKLFSGEFPSVIVQLDVLRKKSVPIDVFSSVYGQDDIAAGYEIVDITCTPSEVDIAGDFSVLSDISSIGLVPYNVSGAATSVVVLLDYQPVDGVRILTHDKAQVFINIREKTDIKEFGRIELRARNLGAGKSVRLGTRYVDVTVLAGLSHLSALSRADVAPYIDLEGLSAGTFTLPVLFELPPGFTAENFSPSAATVTVTVY